MATIDIFTESTQKEILNELEIQNSLVKIIASGWNVSDWRAVQEIVRSGGGPRYFPVGTEFNVTTQSYGTLIFVVIAHNQHKNPDDSSAHTMTLLMKHVINGMQFDSQELLWANTTSAEMPAGTYHFTSYKGDYPQDTKEDGTFQFTCTKPIPVNGGFGHSRIGIWRSSYGISNILGAYIATYNADGTVIESGLTLSEGSDGTDLGTFSVKAENMNVTIGKANCTSRSGGGSNNWSQSGIRQWLNGTDTDWWLQQTVHDRKPSYAAKLGFLSDLDSSFVDVLGYVNNVTARNIVYEDDGITTLGGSFTTSDKVFLPSMTEVGFGNNNGVSEGSITEYYKGASNTDRIKYDYSSTSSARAWWLRSPTYSRAYSVRLVTSSGALDNDLSYGGYGAAAACVIY